jgi:hypothetical protein
MPEQENNRNQEMQESNPNKSNETGGSSNAGEETPIYLTTDSTLQTSEEAAHDRSIDPTKDDSMDVSDTDLRQSDVDRFAGSDRAGTSERKDNTI